jgi:hypothetical protein
MGGPGLGRKPGTCPVACFRRAGPPLFSRQQIMPTSDPSSATESRVLGSSADDVWLPLLARPDRFMHVNPDITLEPATTSADHVDR